MQFSGMALSIREMALKWLTPRWALYAAIFLMLNQLAMLTWRLWLPAEIPTPALLKATLPQVKTASSETSAAYNFTLFGTAAPSTAKAIATPTGSDASLLNAPPSALKINLTGIVASPTPANSIAIIAKDSKQFSLAIGDSTPGYDAKVAAIFPDRVVISYQGRYEALLLFGDSPAVAKTGGGRENSIHQGPAQAAAAKHSQLSEYFPGDGGQQTDRLSPESWRTKGVVPAGRAAGKRSSRGD